MPSTSTKLTTADVAGRFLAQVQKLAEGKTIIPVWTTECEKEDLALNLKATNKWSTGYCGSVECFRSCPTKFREQWLALHAHHRGPTGVLLLHKELGRDRKEYSAKGDWIRQTMHHLQDENRVRLPRLPLWAVVQGYDVNLEEERAAQAAATRTGARVVVLARSRIDQSFEPRFVTVQSK
jgi:hypothetical protein